MKKDWRSTALSFALLLVVIPVSRAQKGSAVPADRERERRSFAQNLVKAISAAEAGYFKQHGVYATWDTLQSLGDFSQNGTKWASSEFPTVAHALYGSAPEIVPGWKLRLHLSNKDQAYDLLLEDATDAQCGYAVSTDERSMIRQSRPLNCSMQLK